MISPVTLLHLAFTKLSTQSLSSFMDSYFIINWHTLLATSHYHGQMIPRCLNLFCPTFPKTPTSKALLSLHFFESLLFLVSTRPSAQLTSLCQYPPPTPKFPCPQSFPRQAHMPRTASCPSELHWLSTVTRAAIPKTSRLDPLPSSESLSTTPSCFETNTATLVTLSHPRLPTRYLLYWELSD